MKIVTRSLVIIDGLAVLACISYLNWTHPDVDQPLTIFAAYALVAGTVYLSAVVLCRMLFLSRRLEGLVAAGIASSVTIGLTLSSFHAAGLAEVLLVLLTAVLIIWYFRLRIR